MNNLIINNNKVVSIYYCYASKEHYILGEEHIIAMDSLIIHQKLTATVSLFHKTLGIQINRGKFEN